MDTIERFEFVVEYCTLNPPGSRYVATLGDYDKGAPMGNGSSPMEAIIDWIELHGEGIGA